jgi:hypothetical protein
MVCVALLPQMVVVSTQETKRDLDLSVQQGPLQDEGRVCQPVDLGRSAGIPIVELGLRDMPPSQKSIPFLRAIHERGTHIS